MPKPKLTLAQRVILSAAGGRETGLILPLPKSLARKQAALEEDIRALVDQGLAVARASLPGEVPWSTPEGGDRQSLVITADGLAAVGMTGDSEGAVGVVSLKAPRAKVANKAKRAASSNVAIKAVPKKAGGKVSTKEAEDAPRTTKLDRLITALRQRKGATIQDLMEMTGWQAHSVRGAMSGALKNRMSLNVVSTVIEGRGRVYRIEGALSK